MKYCTDGIDTSMSNYYQFAHAQKVSRARVNMSDEAQAISSAISGAVSGVIVPWLTRRSRSTSETRAGGGRLTPETRTGGGRSTSETRAGGGRPQLPVGSDNEDFDTRPAKR